MRKLLPGLAILVLMAACSPQAAETAAPTASAQTAATTHPTSGLKVIPLTVTGNGKRHDFHVEVAASPEEQAKGLMFRTELGADEGMIFPRNPPSQASFWMKNTVIPLDIIFIGTDGLISNIAAETVPYSLDPVTSDGLASAVLELAGGRAAQLGIHAGDRVKY